jgi:deoxyadenosine/deoxycytidine kinase
MFIIVSGPIGVGKSTVTRIYSEITGSQAMYETVEHHPFLEKFYKNPKEFAFRVQAFFLWDRFNKHLQAVKSGENIVADRSIYEDSIFAKVLNLRGEMDDDEYHLTYSPHFKILTDILPPPDLMIYLRASLDTLMYRIAQRARDMEKSMDRNYLDLLCRHYEEWIEAYPHRKLIVETDNLDLTCDLHQDWLHLCEVIHSKVMKNDIPDTPLDLSKLKEQIPTTHKNDKREKIKEQLFAPQVNKL